MNASQIDLVEIVTYCYYFLDDNFFKFLYFMKKKIYFFGAHDISQNDFLGDYMHTWEN